MSEKKEAVYYPQTNKNTRINIKDSNNADDDPMGLPHKLPPGKTARTTQEPGYLTVAFLSTSQARSRRELTATGQASR